jgi:hypothetical protein
MMNQTTKSKALMGCALVAVGLGCSLLSAQAAPAGLGSGKYVNLGAEGAFYQAQYGQQRIAGVGAYADANLYRRLGVEGEFRTLRFHNNEDVRETTWMVGPRVSFHLHHALRPYVKVLAGRAQFNYPFSYAQGSYVVYAPGGGVDWQVGRSRLTLRAVDFEYQQWPGFSFGRLSPYGFSAGASYQLFGGRPE